MKKNLFSILLVVVMTMALVACGSQSTNVSAPEATETVNEAVETTDTENSEAVSTLETSTEVVEPESGEATSEPEQATEAPVDEVASTPDSEAVESVPESEASEPETSEPEFTFTEVSKTLYAVQSVNVRSGPSTDFNKIGSLSTNQEVQVISRCNETGWYKFIWTDGSEACVSDKYLSDSKVEVQASTNNSGSSGGQASSGAKNWQDYYADHTWYDMNEFMFIIVDSRDEGCSGIDYSGAEATLQERFPGEKVFLRYGSELRDGHWMYFAYVRPETNGVSAFNKQFK